MKTAINLIAMFVLSTSVLYAADKIESGWNLVVVVQDLDLDINAVEDRVESKTRRFFTTFDETIVQSVNLPQDTIARLMDLGKTFFKELNMEELAASQGHFAVRVQMSKGGLLLTADFRINDKKDMPEYVMKILKILDGARGKEPNKPLQNTSQ